MLVIKVELWPQGREALKSSLGVAEIANIGGTKEVGEYAVRLLKRGERRATWKTGEVKGFPRLRLGAWDLLFAALAGLVAGRSPTVRLPSDWDAEAPEDGRRRTAIAGPEAKSLAEAEEAAELRGAVAEFARHETPAGISASKEWWDAHRRILAFGRGGQ